jgi:CheY-like chemotaxis protein
MSPVPAHQTARPRILLVEDEVLVRVTVSDLLREAGFTVIEAATADIAWRFLEASEPVDLVFSDVESPGSLDGYSSPDQFELDSHRSPGIGGGPTRRRQP